jgi:hypothetical protein
MKTNKFLPLILIFILSTSSCSKDDESTPEPVNEEELITTLEVTLMNNDLSSIVKLTMKDLDGDGPNAPVITVSGNLISGTSYDGVVKVLNESEFPPEDITLEVEEEDLEHQFFFTVGGGLDVTTSYSNFDSAGNNLGTELKLEAGSVSNGTLTVTLRHEPAKPNTGLADAGGETDIEATFNVSIE